MAEERMAFADNTEPTGELNAGVKLDGKKSRFASAKSDGPTQEEFEQNISEHQARNKAIMARSQEFSVKFVNLIKDTTLAENKGPLEKQKESEVARELCNIAINLNNDEYQEYDGMGSVGVTMLLLKTNLLQRDIINNLHYKIYLLNKSVDEINTKLNGK